MPTETQYEVTLYVKRVSKIEYSSHSAASQHENVIVDHWVVFQGE